MFLPNYGQRQQPCFIVQQGLLCVYTTELKPGTRWDPHASDIRASYLGDRRPPQGKVCYLCNPLEIRVRHASAIVSSFSRPSSQQCPK